MSMLHSIDGPPPVNGAGRPGGPPDPSADRSGRRFAVILPERLDGTTATEIRAALSLALDVEPCREVLIDVSAVRVVDGVGLGLLLAGHRACRRTGRKLILVDPSAGLLRLLAVTRLHRVLHLDRGRREPQPGAVGVAASA